MAVTRRLNLFSGARYDLPFLRSEDSSTSADFDSFCRGVFTGLNKPYIIRGFNIQIPNAATLASSLVVDVADSVLLHSSASESGTILSVPAGTQPDVLSSANPNVIGSFQNGAINYVALDYRRVTDQSTDDVVATWSPAQQLEFQQIAPIGTILQYRYVISPGGFGTLLPLYIVSVDNTGAVQYITKCTPNMFRLGSGGANPNPQNSFNYYGLINPQTGTIREYINENQSIISTNPLAVAPGTDPNAFLYGDFAIENFKDWADAIMTRLKQIGNSSYWYLSSLTPSNLPNVFDTWWDSAGSVMTGAGSISYNLVLQATAPSSGAFQSPQSDYSASVDSSYVLGVTSGTEAIVTFFNGSQLVINSPSSSSTTPFVYGEVLQDRRDYAMNYANAQLEDIAPGNGTRYGIYSRISTNANPTIAVSSWSYASQLVTINTATAHGLNVGDQVAVAGLILQYTTWSNVTAYSIGNTVSYSGKYYYSLINSNTNNEPDTSPSDWQETNVTPPQGVYLVKSVPSTTQILISSAYAFSGVATVNGLSLISQETPFNSTSYNYQRHPYLPRFSVSSWSYSGTTITVNAPNHNFSIGEVVVISGLTAGSGAPNGRYTVTATPLQNEFQFVAGVAPTGTPGIALDSANVNPVGFARYDSYSFPLSVSGAIPAQFDVVNSAASCVDDCQFIYPIGAETIPPLGLASGPIQFDGVVAVSSVSNPIQVQSITNDGAGNLTVTTYIPNGIVSAANTTITIFGDQTESAYFQTYLNVNLVFVNSQQFIIQNTGLPAGPTYTNTNTTNPSAWSSVTNYTTNTVVAYSGQYYIALQPSLNQIPSSSPTYWAITYIAGVSPVFIRFANNPYPGPIQWSSNIIIKGIIGNKAFVIPQTATANGDPLADQFNVNGVTGTAYLQDREAAYIVLQRNLPVSASATYTTSNGNQVTGANPPLDINSNYLQSGDFVKFVDEPETDWFQIAGVPGTNITGNSFTLVQDNGQATTPAQRSSRSGALVYCKGYYDTVTVQPHWEVPNSTDVYWIAVRRDNGSAISKVYLRDLQLTPGEVRNINEGTSNNLLTYTGAGSEAATNPNYSTADKTGQYQYSQTLTINEVEETTWMVSFYSGPELGFQVGDYIQQTIGSNVTTYSIKEVLSGLSVVLNQNVSTISNVASISANGLGLVTVTTVAPHGLSTGNIILMSGVAPDVFNGPYTITVTGSSTFTYSQPLAASLTGTGGFVSLNNPLTLEIDQEVLYLQNDFSVKDADNLTLAIRKEDRQLATVNTALSKTVYDESFFAQQISLTGSGNITSGDYVYTGSQNSPSFLAWVLNGTQANTDIIEGNTISMPGGSFGSSAILVAVISGSVLSGAALYQRGVNTGMSVSGSLSAPSIPANTEIVLPPNRRTQVVSGGSYTQWPSYLAYKASTSPYLAGEELLVVINDSVRQANVDYEETFGGPKGKIEILRVLPPETTIRCRSMSSYGSAVAANSSGTSLQLAYDASSNTNYTITEIPGFPLQLNSAGGTISALNVFGSVDINGSGTGGIFGSSDKSFVIGSEANKPAQSWTGEESVKTHVGFTGSASQKFTAAITTTTNSASPVSGTATTIVPSGGGTPAIYRIKISAVANRTDGTMGVAALEVYGAFYSVISGTVVGAGMPQSQVIGYDGDGVNYALAFGIQGNQVVGVVYGASAAVNWALTVEVQGVIGST